MTDLRTAAQQALEALENLQPIIGNGLLDKRQLAFIDPHLDVAITALRAALAQQAEPVEPHRDLRAALKAPGCERLREWVEIGPVQRAALETFAAALAQQAEPVEPVAWMYTGIKQDDTEHGPHLVWQPEYMDAMSASKGAKATPLYTAPPPQPTPSMAEITRLRAERDALAERLREVRAQLNDTTDRHRQKVVMNAWAADRLARHGIPMPEAPTCPDCHGVGYDASGQTCACQENPSF